MVSETLRREPVETNDEDRPILDEKGFRTEGYLASEQGKKEMDEEAKYMSLYEHLEEKARNGEITNEEFLEEAGRKYDEFDEFATKAREDYQDGIDHTADGESEDGEPDGFEKNIEDLSEEELDGERETIDEEIAEIDRRLEEIEEGKDNEDDEEIEDDEEDGTEIEEENPEDLTEEEELEGEKETIDEEIAEIDEKLGEDEESEEEKIEKEAKKDRERRIKELSEELDKIRPELAELYARNRRLFVGKKNAYKFAKAENRYEEVLDEYTKLKAKDTFETGKQEALAHIEHRVEEMKAEIEAKIVEFAGGDLDNTEKTDEEINEERDRLNKEAEEKLKAEYDAKIKELETKVNAEFLKDYLAERSELEDETIDKLDNGTLSRKFVSKVLNNKHLKRALIVAGAAGLAIGGGVLAAGLAAGTMAVGFGYTAGGIAAGAAKGLFTGSLMSRQDSKNSAVREFVSEEDIKKKLKGINILTLDSKERGVASWLIDQYQEANEEDASSNKKRTLISAGIGAALGAIASGVQINNVSSHTETDKIQIGTEPTKIDPAKFNDVNIPKGHGAYDTFTQMGGDPSNMQKALDVMYNIDAKYGLVPGSNGEVAGINGLVGNFAHTYPGPISSWPDAAQSYIRDVAEEWVRQGLIPGNITGGGPIYDTVTRTVMDYVPNAFMNFLTRGVAYAGAGAISGAIGGRQAAEKEVTTGEPEDNPGGNPGEDTRDNPETESSEYNFVNNIKNLIENNPSMVGGRAGIDILTSESDVDGAKIQEYWDGLDYDSKVYVYGAMEGINNFAPEGSDVKWGKSFRSWLQNKTRDELFPSRAETGGTA